MKEGSVALLLAKRSNDTRDSYVLLDFVLLSVSNYENVHV